VATKATKWHNPVLETKVLFNQPFYHPLLDSVHHSCALKTQGIVYGDDSSKNGNLAAARAQFAATKLPKKWKGLCHNRQDL
jgi:hypothetical protein